MVRVLTTKAKGINQFEGIGGMEVANFFHFCLAGAVSP